MITLLMALLPAMSIAQAIKSSGEVNRKGAFSADSKRGLNVSGKKFI